MFGPLIVKPVNSKGDKTGSWRIISRPKFLKTNCIACKLCVLACPEGCIEGKEKNSFISDYTFCKGCGLCSFICPKKDIIMEDETTQGKEK